MNESGSSHLLGEDKMAYSERQDKMITIHIFGALRHYMDDQKLPYSLEKAISSDGYSAYQIAKEISLPLEKIEAVFRNGGVINIYDSVFPGDRLAFFPHGTPGPYRLFLGMTRENLERAQQEKKSINIPAAGQKGKT